MSDARQRLLDALAEVDRLDKESLKATTDWIDSGRMAELEENKRARRRLRLSLHALLPTLAALKEVVEEHSYSPDDGVDYCDKCGYCAPCPTLRTLARQFEKEDRDGAD